MNYYDLISSESDEACLYSSCSSSNLPPELQNINVVVDEDAFIDTNVFTAASDPENNIEITSLAILVFPENGTATFTLGSENITYEPNENFNGNDTLTYLICDQGQPILCDTAHIFYTINPQNDPPHANDDFINIEVNQETVINILGNDLDVDGVIDPANVAIISNPNHGVINYDMTTGLLHYEPTNDFSGSDSLNYRICDNPVNLQFCSEATVFIEVIDNTCIMDTEAPVITLNHPLLIGLNSGDTLEMQCGATTLFYENDATVTDNCDPNPIIELKEGNIQVSNCADNDFIVWMECYWEAVDASGNISQYLIYIKVIDEESPIFINVPIDITISCSDIIPNTSPHYSDNCTPVDLIQLTAEEMTIAGACDESELIIRTWMITDQCGNTNQTSQQIFIQDLLAPTISDAPDNIVIDESMGQTVPLPPNLIAQDNCDNNVSVIFSEIVTEEDCERLLNRSWTATDNCGNVSTTNQLILVVEDCTDCILPIVENIGLSPTICNQATGAANIEVEGDESNYTYTWIPDFGTSTSVISNARVDLPAGDYLVVINFENQANCEDKIEFSIDDDCGKPASVSEEGAHLTVDDNTKTKVESIQPASDLTIFAGFSPNGDGINDYFTINGLEKYDAHHLHIYNKWGKLIFQSKDYQNDWDGTFEDTQLPAGTYFYALSIRGKKSKSGYIQIGY